MSYAALGGSVHDAAGGRRRKRTKAAGDREKRSRVRRLVRAERQWRDDRDYGSIIIVVATGAPLLPHHLKRLARRASLGLARTGATSSNYSGDLFLAFSTANPGAASGAAERTVRMLSNESLDPIFTATVDAVEEAITNVLFAAGTMTGYQGHRVEALPVDRVLGILKERRVLR